jgi:hypothetical protein
MKPNRLGAAPQMWGFLCLKKRRSIVQNGRMKLQLLSKILLVVLTATFVQACATTGPTTGIGALTGSWSNSLGTVWTMRADGSFDVDLNHDGKRDAWGTCKVDGDRVTIVGTGGVVPKGCAKTTGSYHFTRKGNTLHFMLIKDHCAERVKNVTLDWTKK